MPGRFAQARRVIEDALSIDLRAALPASTCVRGADLWFQAHASIRFPHPISTTYSTPGKTRTRAGRLLAYSEKSAQPGLPIAGL